MIESTFFGTELSLGKHELVLYYENKYVKYGVLLSSFGVGILLIGTLLGKKRNLRVEEKDVKENVHEG